MLRSRYTRRTYYSSPQCEFDIDTIKNKYNVSTDSDAIRLALTLVAQSPVAVLPKPKKRN